jgi:enoyl-CoA hydratase/carnithine racemase
MPPRSPTLVCGDDDDFALGGDAAPAELHALFRRLIALGIPTAVVRGGCLGAALELAAFCNFVFAARDARFGACPAAGVRAAAQARARQRRGSALLRRRALGRRGLSPRPRARTAPALLVETLAETWLAAHVLNKTAGSLRRANRVARATFHNRLQLDVAPFDLAASARAYSASHVPRLHRS